MGAKAPEHARTDRQLSAVSCRVRVRARWAGASVDACCDLERRCDGVQFDSQVPLIGGVLCREHVVGLVVESGIVDRPDAPSTHCVNESAYGSRSRQQWLRRVATPASRSVQTGRIGTVGPYTG